MLKQEGSTDKKAYAIGVTQGRKSVRLSEVESRGVLNAARVARLGCIVDVGPYIVPINYYFEDGRAYCHSLPGLKIAALRKTHHGVWHVRRG